MPTNSKYTSLSYALCWRTEATFVVWMEEKAEVPGFIMPDLCHAMSSIVGPNRWIWSSAIEVMPTAVGDLMMFVASHSPPRWVSIIATSTFSSMKTWKARRANSWRYLGISKVEVGWLGNLAHISKNRMVKHSSDIGSPSIRTLSRIFRICGDV